MPHPGLWLWFIITEHLKQVILPTQHTKAAKFMLTHFFTSIIQNRASLFLFDFQQPSLETETVSFTLIALLIIVIQAFLEVEFI